MVFLVVAGQLENLKLGPSQDVIGYQRKYGEVQVAMVRPKITLTSDHVSKRPCGTYKYGG